MTTTAGGALTVALAEDIDRLFDSEPHVRCDAPDSVHQMRVATRRLRSVLRSYRALFDKRAIADTGAELKWLADLLGEARDAQVRAERFAALIAEVPGADTAAVTARLVTAQRDRYRDAHERITSALDDDRYLALRAELARWRDKPPLRTARAETTAQEYFGVVLERDRERVEALIRREPTVAPAERVELLHDIRKSAKRLRYSGEAAQPSVGELATELGQRAKRLQTVLGDHRDAVESHEAILAVAEEAATAGEDTAAYAALAAEEDAAAGRALSGYPARAAALTGWQNIE
ncbi:CHAD domain-containing protein [Nocardia callitridis]|uniref:CHAD domain-containing protein n=1 Tax=Nocardia callitridis TaxID=648753 RepID=A0ABP9KG09_9NOCA